MSLERVKPQRRRWHALANGIAGTDALEAGDAGLPCVETEASLSKMRDQ